MKRLVMAVVALCFVAGRARADEPSKESQPTKGGGRKKLEAVLKAPAGLDFGERKQVAAREILDQLRERHHFSMRLDLPTFAALFGPESISSQKQRGPKGAKPAGYPQAPFALSAIRSQLSPPAAYFTDDVRSVRNVGRYAASAPIPVGVSITCPPADLYAGPTPLPPSPAPIAAEVRVNDRSAATLAPTSSPTPVPTPTPSRVAGPLPQPEPVRESKPDSKSKSEDAEPKTEKAEGENPETDHPGIREALDAMEIDIATIDLKEVSVATVLRHVLDAAPMVLDDFSGFPIPMTNAMLLDYVLEDDGLLITTRMKALTSKETKVYSVKHLSDCPPEQLSKLIRQSIRPWSWRSQINDLGDQLKGMPLPPELLGSIVKSGVQLAGAEIGATVTAGENGDKPGTEKKEGQGDEARDAAMVGNAIANGLIAFAHATLSALEMFHYAEPPSGTIQTLPGKLIIRQSQAAHREIGDLLEQLAEK